MATPSQKTIQEVSDFLSINPSQCLKTLIVKGETQPLVALVLRGDHQLNDIKAEKLDAIKSPLTLASEADVNAHLSCETGFIGPCGLHDIPVIADYAAAELSDFTCGANKTGFHLTHVNWQRDCEITQAADLRNAMTGDPSPDGQGHLQIRRGIEVGHIFQLGRKYSEALKASVLAEDQSQQTMTMGCYGIGVTRVVAAAIEQHHDENGITWPASIAPFQLAIAPINFHKSDEVKQFCEDLYDKLSQQGIEVLLFDTEKARLGGILADIELMGIPHRLVIGAKGLEKNAIEYRARKDEENQTLTKDRVLEFVLQQIQT